MPLLAASARPAITRSEFCIDQIMETIDSVQGYPLTADNPKYTDYPTLSQYDAYIGTYIQNELPCNGCCACKSPSYPYTAPPPPKPRITTPPSRAQQMDIHSRRVTPVPISIGISSDIPPPPPPAHPIAYHHSYPSQPRVIIQTVPRVSDISRMTANFPESTTYSRPAQPVHHPEYHPHYTINHYASSSPVYVHSKYYTSHIVPSAYHHSATAPPPTVPVRTSAVSAATNPVPITPVSTPRNVSRDINIQKAPPKQRYYGYSPPTTATKTMNNRRPVAAGERKEIRKPISMDAGANAPNGMVCSFHMDFIPKLDDLRKYLSAFGEVVNKIEIEWDCMYGGGPNIDGPIKGVPMAKIQFKSEVSAQRVCDTSCTHVIPSGIKFRAYRSMSHYVNSYKKKKSKKKRKK